MTATSIERPFPKLMPSRAIAPSPAFWFAMYAASGLGTNVGDFWAHTAPFGLVGSGLALAALVVAMIVADRALGLRTEAFYWLALVFLRAIATNIGDLAVDVWRVGFVVATLSTCAATLAAGACTTPSDNGATPKIDLRYWIAMFLGGVFGTVGGDFASHSFGLAAAGVGLGLLLLLVIPARARFAPTALIGYWLIVLAERLAGTPLGDYFAGRHGLALGLPTAMAITGALLVAGLVLRRAGR